MNILLSIPWISFSLMFALWIVLYEGHPKLQWAGAVLSVLALLVAYTIIETSQWDS